MQRGRATAAVVGTLEGMNHGENSCVNNGTTAVGPNFHVNTDFDRNGTLHGLGGRGGEEGANSSTDNYFLGLRIIVSTAGG